MGQACEQIRTYTTSRQHLPDGLGEDSRRSQAASRIHRETIDLA